MIFEKELSQSDLAFINRLTNEAFVRVYNKCSSPVLVGVMFPLLNNDGTMADISKPIAFPVHWELRSIDVNIPSQVARMSYVVLIYSVEVPS